MRTLLFALFIFTLAGTSSYAQGVLPKSLETLEKPTIPFDIKAPITMDTLEFDSKLNYSLKDQQELFAAPKGSYFDLRREIPPVELQDEQVDLMPIYEPQGDFAMRTYVPDSSKNYTIRIKKHE
ncbi:hypothetical protein PBT90_09520 [Algoriphagus halophytocola]|uniref:Uncharacterized protein n=1 Tax=Algoriphagus halophytocola TaxID=2991499 RepID=A0ABY6MIL8_9BACT|nr:MULTISPECIES: hypothetical protein [unclassified Algoriphagus]UZD23627.1 hypothetical protein OM944_03850 [Algoriphagus sp. TR-M5]WBL44920.1 hypothetical protein PBT90_09520 [Algoriphagus sp. TR-M9]